MNIVEGLFDTVMSLFLPTLSEVMVGVAIVVVGWLHSVSLSAYTHCVMFVPFDNWH